MLYESRSYALHPGKLPEYLAAFGGDAEVLAILARRLAGFWITESGQLNGVQHLWRYENRAARAAARAAMAGEPAMGRFFSKVTPLLQTQHSRLLAGQIAQGNATRTGGVYDRVRLVLRPDAGAAGERLADVLYATLARHFEPVANLRDRMFESAGPLTEALFVLRSASLDERDHQWAEANPTLRELDGLGTLAKFQSELVLPAAFSPWR